MFVEQPPSLYRKLFPNAVWRLAVPCRRVVYLTFDDGPIPEVTPRILDVLDYFEVKATFFMVGDNVRKYPELYQMVREQGHSVGNHSMHHMRGINTTVDAYVDDVRQAAQYIPSTLFRPPHGFVHRSQARILSEEYRIIMFDVVTRDYDARLTSDDIVECVKKYTRNGSIIVFHDSLKSVDRLTTALPESIRWLKSQGYEFDTLPME